MKRSIYITLIIAGALLVPLNTAYVKDNARFSTELTQEQKDQANAIMNEARPRIKELRKEVDAKLEALQEFCFEKSSDGQTLAQLGEDLQKARENLRNEFISLDKKLMQELGVSIRGYRGRSSAHLAREAAQDNVHFQKHIMATPHHGEH